jgi:pimeloyl-ACP methyl ester carboxylesterase
VEDSCAARPAHDKETTDPSDYIATLDADLAHDATQALPEINAPHARGRRDRDFFFPEPILRETAERIPNATLRLYDGVGDPVGKTHKRRFEADVLAFLNG